MDIFATAPHYTFDSRTAAEAFCKRIKDITYKCDVVTMNDIFRDRGDPIKMEGFQYGYTRRETKKLKPEKIGLSWQVIFPCPPGKMVRGNHGYWTTENAKTTEAIDKGGG